MREVDIDFKKNVFSFCWDCVGIVFVFIFRIELEIIYWDSVQDFKFFYF